MFFYRTVYTYQRLIEVNVSESRITVSLVVDGVLIGDVDRIVELFTMVQKTG